MLNQSGQSFGLSIIGDGFSFRLPTLYEWKPASDITAYELALCIPVLLAKMYEVEAMIQRLPDAAKRHFQAIEKIR